MLMEISKEVRATLLGAIPLVSVVMATYAGDHERHLAEAIGSILAQDYLNLELLIVVDGPVPAERTQFLERVAANARVRLLHVVNNSGPAHARNLGITHASGSFIAIMDADDFAKPDRISHQLEAIDRSGLDVISSDLDIIDEDGNVTGCRTVPRSHRAIRASAPFRCPLHNPSLFAKTSVLKENPYDIGLRVGEDYELWIRLMLKGYRFGNTSYRCVSYRQSPAAVVKRTGIKYAVSDFRIKVGAVSLASFPKKPFVLIFAVGTAIARLLPMPVFGRLYSTREQFFAILK
jgi:glycosyltransferase involved in cell wall biosynthesis